MTIDAITIALTSVSLSVDAMTVNATNGLQEKKIAFKKVLLASFLFGLFQALMPTIGYFCAQTFQQYVTPFIPWIGFGLLGSLGVKSLIDWIKDFRHRKDEEPIEEKKISIGTLFVEAIATSIDALCIGFAYMNAPIVDAMIFFGIIGVTTMVLSLLTALLAKKLSKFLSSYAGLFASIVFFGIAIKILLEGIL
ncbi:MAG: manganese efflux pump [Candidatus Enteromonas sp.]|nr:manganese efflux pump [Candidatus Enteromonas sp.]